MALIKWFLLFMGTSIGAMFAAALCIAILAHNLRRKRAAQFPVPISVNYHFTRECNKACGFCFHTAKTSHLASIEEAKRGLALLKQAGMKKINFAGGEPFLKHKFLGESRKALGATEGTEGRGS